MPRNLQSTAQPEKVGVTANNFPRIGVACLLGLLIGLTFFGYSAAFNGPFLFDDLTLPFASPLTSKAPLSSWISGVRPMLMFSYWLNYQLSETASLSYHLTNVALHALNGFLFFLICRNVLRTKFEGSRVIAGALFASAIFLLHPLQTESVAYVAGRSEILSATFVMLAWWTYLRTVDRPIGWAGSFFILTFFAFAAATKEQAVVTVPAILLLTDWCIKHRPFVGAVRANWRIYVPLGAIAALGTAWVARILVSSSSAGTGLGISPLEYFYTQCRAILIYLGLVVLPVGQNADYDFPISHTPWEHGAAFALLALLALLIPLFRQSPFIRYGGLLFAAFLAPTSSFMPLADALVEHRLYLPLAGLAIIAGAVIANLRVPVQRLALACSAWCIFALVLTTHRSQVWSDPVWLWGDVVTKSPRKDRAYPHLTHALIAAGKCPDAIQRLESAKDVMPHDYYILYNWARAYACASQPEAALGKLREAEQVVQTADVYALMGMIHAAQGKTDVALHSFEKALAKEPPGTDLAHVYRGHMFLLMGEKDKAEAEYQRALLVNPYSPEAITELRRLSAVGRQSYRAREIPESEGHPY